MNRTPPSMTIEGASRTQLYYQRNKETIKKQRRASKDRINTYNKEYRVSRKEECFKRYGGSCAHCGETDVDVLTIDHINDDGAEHRKKMKGDSIYNELVKNHFPDGFQTLCRNCNWSKHVNHGKCLHERNLGWAYSIP